MTELSHRGATNIGSPPAGDRWPATFAELNGTVGEKGCARCHDLPATHSVSVSVAKLGAGRGALVATSRAKLCEACAVRIYGPVAKALR